MRWCAGCGGGGMLVVVSRWCVGSGVLGGCVSFVCVMLVSFVEFWKGSCCIYFFSGSVLLGILLRISGVM